jgi:hypothetical protein
MSSILYKFLSSDRLDYFSNELIRASQPSVFNDPFECQPELSKDFYEIVKNNSQNPESSVDNEQFGREVMGEGRKILDREIGIISFSRTKKNILMWSHYANGHRGFCIGFDRELGRYEKDGKIYNLIKPVRYSSNRIKLPVSGNQHVDQNLIFVKASCWSYEKEERLVLRLSDNNDSKEIENSNYVAYLYKIDYNFIRGVIIGCEASDETRFKIKHFCSKRNIKCYQAKIDLENFKLTFQLLYL